MFSFIFTLLQSRLHFSDRIVGSTLAFLDLLHRLVRGKEIFGPANRNRVRLVLDKSRNLPENTGNLNSQVDLTLIIVAAEKDFSLLNFVLMAARKKLSHYKIEKIQIVVPDHLGSHKTLGQLASNDPKVQIIAESVLLDVIRLREIFSAIRIGRENWCLQQFLKYYSVLNCESDFALVLDADTVILNSTSWITENNKFLLMPTLEYTKDYYEVLIKLGILDEMPKFSFVPHHMFYSINEFKELHDKLGNLSPIQFATKLKEISNQNTESPFCIDYELYAQYLYANQPEKVELGRWANCSISRKWTTKLKSNRQWEIALFFLSFFFNSISMHSWFD